MFLVIFKWYCVISVCIWLWLVASIRYGKWKRETGRQRYDSPDKDGLGYAISAIIGCPVINLLALALLLYVRIRDEANNIDTPYKRKNYKPGSKVVIYYDQPSDPQDALWFKTINSADVLACGDKFVRLGSFVRHNKFRLAPMDAYMMVSRSSDLSEARERADLLAGGISVFGKQDVAGKPCFIIDSRLPSYQYN